MAVADIHRLTPINLEDAATLNYIPANAANDPLSETYRGVEPMGGSSTVISDW